jgi:hypothetical protein
MIATRTLKLQRDGDAIDIGIRIFAPRASGRDWSCRFEIDWPDGRLSRGAYGVDSMQALVLALQMIGADIYTSAYHKSGQLMFEAPGRGYGFPVPASIRHLMVGDDRADGT